MFIEATAAISHTMSQIANLSGVIEQNECRIKEVKAEASRIRKMTTDEFADSVSSKSTKGGYLAKLKSEVLQCEELISSYEAYKAELMTKLAA